ncbi:hypothetical protein D3C77_478070 [compost metagenome]
MSDNNKLTTGILILAAGVIIFLGKLGVFSFLGRAFWPLLILIPGIVLHLLYFWGKAPAELLLPGGILTVYSIIFFIANFWGWDTLGYTWPLFILGVSVGLFELDGASSRRNSLLFTGAIVLGVVSLFALLWSMFSLPFMYLVAACLIIVGIIMILGKGRRRRSW